MKKFVMIKNHTMVEFGKGEFITFYIIKDNTPYYSNSVWCNKSSKRKEIELNLLKDGYEYLYSIKQLLK